MKKQVREILIKNSDEKYKKFSSSLLPNVNNVLGVRLPILRKLAKKYAKQDCGEFLSQNEFEFMEEIMLLGMIIGLLCEKSSIGQSLAMVKKFIPKINNWSVCDSFVSSLKFTKNYKDEVFRFLMTYKNSKSEYELRFLLVMFLTYFLEEKYLDEIFCVIKEAKLVDYYSKMAASWLIATLLIDFPNQGLDLIKSYEVDIEIRKKAIQKGLESFRVAKDIKGELKRLRRTID